MNWIKCSERMPTEYDFYLVVVTDPAAELTQVTELLWDDDCERWCGHNWIPVADNVVTHWQPLPEPPND